MLSEFLKTSDSGITASWQYAMPGVSICRFQLIQKEQDLLELRILAEDPQTAFQEAKQRLQGYLLENGVHAEIICSDTSPEANPVSGKFQHIIAMKK